MAVIKAWSLLYSRRGKTLAFENQGSNVGFYSQQSSPSPWVVSAKPYTPHLPHLENQLLPVSKGFHETKIEVLMK